MAIRNWFVRLMADADIDRFYSPPPPPCHAEAFARAFGTLPSMDKALDTALVWLRRDLRSDGNAALFRALKAAPAGIAGDPPSLAALGFVRTNLADLKVQGSESTARALLDDFLARIDEYD